MDISPQRASLLSDIFDQGVESHTQIPVILIESPQAKIDKITLKWLEDSIESIGLLSPIGVRRINTNNPNSLHKYRIIYGAHRHAAWLNKFNTGEKERWENIPVFIYPDNINDETAKAYDAEENLARRLLTPQEKEEKTKARLTLAEALRLTRKAAVEETGKTIKQIAQEQGVSTKTIQRDRKEVGIEQKRLSVVEIQNLAAEAYKDGVRGSDAFEKYIRNKKLKCASIDLREGWKAFFRNATSTNKNNNENVKTVNQTNLTNVQFDEFVPAPTPAAPPVQVTKPKSPPPAPILIKPVSERKQTAAEILAEEFADFIYDHAGPAQRVMVLTWLEDKNFNAKLAAKALREIIRK